MKRLFALCMALMLLCGVCALAQDTASCTWQVQDGTLVISVRTEASNALNWSGTVSDRDMLEPVREEFVADSTGLDSGSTMGTWVTAWKPAEQAAGIVDIELACQNLEVDEPTSAWSLQIYLNGEGGISVLSLNGETVEELPVE